MPARIVPVIMCGGAGTRLWPVSRESRPKQFVSLLAGMSADDQRRIMRDNARELMRA